MKLKFENKKSQKSEPGFKMYRFAEISNLNDWLDKGVPNMILVTTI